MRILVAPQELKGTLTATQAAEAIGRGLAVMMPDAELELAPIADGGPGTVDAFARATGARLVEAPAEDPLGRHVPAHFAVKGNLALIEMAEASGLCRVFASERDALRASTRGTGQLIAAALEQGCKELWIGLGGSATTDGGAGALEALGARFLDAEGNRLQPGGGALASLTRFKLDKVVDKLRGVTLVALTDVRAPLLGPTGSAAVFAPQKGASPEEVAELERALGQLHKVVVQQLGRDMASEPGAGAAGGLGYGLMAMCGAAVRDGFGALAELMDLRERIRKADLVVTAEGRLDAQTAMGKGPAALAALAAEEGKPTFIITGSVEPGAPTDAFAFVEVLDGQKGPLPSSAVASTGLEAAARRLSPRFTHLGSRKQD